MTIRQQIIKQLDKPDEPFTECYSHYSDLKQSIELDWGKIPNRSDSVELEDRIDDWFKGVINSLYYRPNKLVLVLEGEQGIGKTFFFRNLLWTNSFFSDIYEKTDVFEMLICDMEFTKYRLDIPSVEDFTIRHPYTERPVADKRLCSYCSTTNKWSFPQRKNFIIVPVKKINFELFNSINKELLWIEIFNKFKQEL